MNRPNMKTIHSMGMVLWSPGDHEYVNQSKCSQEDVY